MNKLINHWYRSRLTWLTALLLPLSWLFGLLIKFRKLLYCNGVVKSYRLNVPVIVVGNITAGGVGKTPLVMWLATFLQNKGYRPGVISRGVGAIKHEKPYLVKLNDTAELSGDEPLMIARNVKCPVVIFADKVLAAQKLINESDCNIIISDDGLQHYRLQRDVEIAVVDGERKFGNSTLLPAGPLREKISRLEEVDFIVVNGLEGFGQYHMQLEPSTLTDLAGQDLGLQVLKDKTVHAIAGIGNPERFFTLLVKLGARVIRHPYPDHYQFEENDFIFNDNYPVVMTEKDAVKCHSAGVKQHWILKVKTVMDERFVETLSQTLERIDYADHRITSSAINLNNL